jgi:hypothetical protein
METANLYTLIGASLDLKQVVGQKALICFWDALNIKGI